MMIFGSSWKPKLKSGTTLHNKVNCPSDNLIIFNVMSNEKERPGIESRPPYNLNKKKGQI